MNSVAGNAGHSHDKHIQQLLSHYWQISLILGSKNNLLKREKK